MSTVCKIVIVIMVALLSLGCSTMKSTYYVDVTGFSKSDFGSEPVRYALAPADKHIGGNDLQFEEYCRYVDSALIKNGYLKAESFDDATVAIFFYYGIGNPEEHQYSYSLPLSEQTGVSSPSIEDTHNCSDDCGNSKGTAAHTAEYEIARYQQLQENNATYYRYLSLSAIDLQKYREDQQVIELWRMEVSSTGSSSDLRVVVPVMVAASAKYIGKNTGKAISISVKDDDPAVIEMRSHNLVED
jgi:hypothetical protein